MGAALDLTQPTRAAILTSAAATGANINFTADSAVFVSSDVGKIIRSGGGKAEIITFTSTTVVVCRIDREITRVVPEDTTNKPLEIASGDWTMTKPATTVTGLHHLEGETVKVFADGNVLPDKVVNDGAVIDITSSSKIIIGLGFTAKGKTLPGVSGERIIEGRRKKVIGLATRVHETRGLKLGSDFDTLYEMKDRTDED